MQLGRDPGAGRRTTCAASTQIIERQLASDVVLVNQVAAVHHRQRRQAPAPPVASCSRPGPAATRASSTSPAAAIIEFIHTATLLHDDVVDGSDMRRGRDTANHVFGNEASVLVGDYLYSRAFQMMVDARRHAHPGRDGRRDQHDRRRRSAAAHERARPGHDRGALPRGHLPQDRQAVRGRRADRARSWRGAPAEIEPRWSTTAGTSARPSSWSTTRSTTSATAGRARQEPGRRPGRGQADAAADLRARALVARGHRARCARAIEVGGIEDLAGVTRAIESSGGLSTLRGSRGGRRISRSKRSAGSPIRRIERASRARGVRGRAHVLTRLRR